MFASFYIIVFEMVLAIYAENSMKPEKLKIIYLSDIKEEENILAAIQL